ncbi:MAG: 30S ribosomal protein S16 [Myxococcota bacterium]|nr:30S ribosomal protein S16 [Myxococcota bacterium]
MATVLRLARYGSKANPYFRVVATNSRSARDGRFIEQVGHYDPRSPENKATLDIERVRYWLAQGARPSDTVAKLIKTSLPKAG